MKPRVKRSEDQSKINPQLIIMLVICGLCVFGAIRFLGSYDGSDPFASESLPVVVATDLPVEVIVPATELTAVPSVFEDSPTDPILIVVTDTSTLIDIEIRVTR